MVEKVGASRFVPPGLPWRVHAVALVVWTVAAVPILASRLPLGALAFPGIFAVVAAWHLVVHFVPIDRVRRPVLSDVPPLVYAVVACLAMWALHRATDEPFYRNQAIWATVLAVPSGIAGLLIVGNRERISAMRREQWSAASEGDAEAA